jgi:serine phosphatase RsbU (regulator of sigma subunit)
VWAVVIGDVCGTGPAAAAVTGLARHTIASAAWHGDDHVTVLKNLNKAMRARDAGPFCTAIYGTLETTADGLELTFAVGGHPLPIVARADGSVTTCGTPGWLIGVFDDIDLEATTTTMHPGDTMVLYTDGATDVAPPHGLTPDAFAEVVGRAASATTTAEQLADHLHADLSSVLRIEDRNDDIALLILRVPRG